MKNKDITILLVDDEPDIIEIVRYNLTAQGYKVKTAENGLEAISIAKKTKPQLILLDVMMPKMNGMEACRKIREVPELSETIIAFLTARGEEYSELAGFDAGADDYITKPIKPKVLVGRVKGLLRRFKQPEIEKLLKFGDLTIIQEEYKIILGQEEMSLPKKEFELLTLLTSQPGKVYKREDILNQIWGSDVIVGDRTIDVHIRKLREKIGDEKFQTIKGVGYKFVV
ncbi:response regulator transcription factor [Aequorivita sp. H23M31]|uniref:Response regulator transcription factor n=1 Tax=Aequorivita ciconiae TaxID=2494375 RepID=A0A410G3I1_9FLAO|nr:response regulator transcription factor [Aequorivita sp. H23M31]QAA81820.1 response regulator transcription factor [Aequorivita sp. H23M31]